jgi:glycosyltransferase involved in cell wall biosynthesis
VPLLPSFADIFSARGLGGRLRAWRLGRLLSGPHVPCVANHSLNASRSVVRALGIAPDRVIPWDWSRLPMAGPARVAPADPAAPRLAYVGALSEDKGLGDLLAAVALLRRDGIAARLAVAGGGAPGPWQARAAGLGLEGAVEFLGTIPNTEARALMAAADLVVVPSRPAYPEGLPNTIYEGLASRAPLLLSDHPAFAGRVADGEGGLVFRAGDPADLARAAGRALTEAGLYARLSAGAEAALAGLHVGLDWPDLVRLFLEDPADRGGWVRRHSLAALGLAP